MRDLLILLVLSAALFADTPAKTSIRGKLIQRDGKPALELSDHKLVPLDGDEPTRGVLKDKRLAGADLDATGHFTNPDQLLVGAIHTEGPPVCHGHNAPMLSNCYAVCC